MHNSREIQEKIDRAVEAGCGEAIISGDFEIEETIYLPSNFTLILSDCHLTMADGVMAQMFCNKGYRQGGNTPETADRNIRLLGRGDAILDGGNYNGLSEKNSCKEGMPHVSRNNILLFCNVDGFEIANLKIRRQRYWALNFLFCANGHLESLDFCADDTRIDEKGNRVQGLLRGHYDEVYVKNADGIDLRQGCHHILVENITGFCEDDAIALTDLDGGVERCYHVEGADRDIHDIVIRNIKAHSYCTIVRLLNQAQGAKMHHILIEGVYDTSKNSPHIDRGIYAVRIGDKRNYGVADMPEDAVSDIVIRGVEGRTKHAVLALAGKMQRVSYEGISAFDGCETILEDLRT